MTEQYQVTIQSQMGPREGVLTLSYQGNYVTGSLDLVGYVNTIQGVRAADGTLHLFHPIQTAVSTIPCETVLNLRAAQPGASTSQSSPKHPYKDSAEWHREGSYPSWPRSTR